jgi:hypothetical protein
MDSLFSFPVGLFHPLQHAGLSRRSPYNRVAVKVTVNQYRVHFHFHEPWCVEVFRVNLYLENLDESSRYRTT